MKILFFLAITVSLSLGQETEVEEFTTGSRLFTSDVYSEFIANHNDNFLVSPFSAEIVLALTQTGAKEATAAEIRTILHLPATEQATESAIKAILPTLQNDQFVLQVANKVYVEENYPIQETFQTVANDVYQAEFQNIEFTQPTEAAEKINQWVEEHTNNKIHDLVGPDSLDPSTKFVLVNALYFHANWTHPFYTDLTKKTAFYKTSDDTVEIETMNHDSIEANYYESEELDAKILELPFQGETAAMVLVLPNKVEGIAVLEKQISKVLAVPEYTRELVQVSLPKFKIETTVDFRKILIQLGMVKAFDPLEADFSGISGEKGELFINNVAQKTFIDVNEVGVEAAAATVIDVTTDVPPPAAKTFIADHPFIFYIRVDDVVLFEGRVLVPNYEK